MAERIHVVCLDAPSPPDYGGAIDMYYKIKALFENGHDIVLHYFDYKPGRRIDEMRPYCTAIYAYKRRSWIGSWSLPYIVGSRINRQLVERLNSDDCPVLLEGLHCSGIAPLINRPERLIIRVHNNESRYYLGLANVEKSLLKRLYYQRESRLLAAYQQSLAKSLKLACLSEKDLELFQQDYRFQNVFFLPCFIPWQKVASREGMGTYCLYHGNLSVSENEEAAIWLMREVFRQLKIPFVIAGRNPSGRLLRLSAKNPLVHVVSNPPDDELRSLIADAHIHVLPSFNATGVKLKLLNALFNGRFCVTNTEGVAGSGLEAAVHIHNTPEEWIDAIQVLMHQAFSAEALAKRRWIEAIYQNSANAARLSGQWKHYH